MKHHPNNPKASHCVKSVRIRSFSGPYFPAFGLMWRDTPNLRIQSECGETNQKNSEYKHFLRSVIQVLVVMLYVIPGIYFL